LHRVRLGAGYGIASDVGHYGLSHSWNFGFHDNLLEVRKRPKILDCDENGDATTREDSFEERIKKVAVSLPPAAGMSLRAGRLASPTKAAPVLIPRGGLWRK
jgi:hypothetical protein